jgi:hypothetical protein
VIYFQWEMKIFDGEILVLYGEKLVECFASRCARFLISGFALVWAPQVPRFHPTRPTAQPAALLPVNFREKQRSFLSF